MRKTILLYGLALAALILLLKIIEYRFFARDLSLEFYLGVVAVLFTILGAWVGLRLTSRNHNKGMMAIPAVDFVPKEDILKRTGISKREYEVLELMAKGNSNQEIADKLFVSLNTVKTHSSNLFVKLDAKRRTQAIQRAKELFLLP